MNEESWRKSFIHQTIFKANKRDVPGDFTDDEKHDFKLTLDYWMKSFPTQHEKTRATVLSVFTGISDVFQRGVLRRIFGTETTMTPEASLDGKIILLDLPEKRFHETGVAAQTLFKFCWQRAVEGRRIENDSRPVFLWMDESQLFVNEHDVRFQTTSRSTRVATVFLTQNLPPIGKFNIGRGLDHWGVVGGRLLENACKLSNGLRELDD